MIALLSSLLVMLLFLYSLGFNHPAGKMYIRGFVIEPLKDLTAGANMLKTSYEFAKLVCFSQLFSRGSNQMFETAVL